MAIYEKPVRLLMKDMVSSLNIREGQIITKQQVLSWFDSNYSKIKSSTMSAHLIRMSINATSRVHYQVNPNGDDDLFFKLMGSASDYTTLRVILHQSMKNKMILNRITWHLSNLQSLHTKEI